MYTGESESYRSSGSLIIVAKTKGGVPPQGGLLLIRRHAEPDWLSLGRPGSMPESRRPLFPTPSRFLAGRELREATDKDIHCRMTAAEHLRGRGTHKRPGLSSPSRSLEHTSEHARLCSIVGNTCRYRLTQRAVQN